MKNVHLDEVLFDKFLEMLESKGIKPQGSTLVDGTFVEVPRQHNTKEENAQIKNSEGHSRLQRTNINLHGRIVMRVGR